MAAAVAVTKIDFDIEGAAVANTAASARSYAQTTCSSIAQTPDQFMDTLGSY